MTEISIDPITNGVNKISLEPMNENIDDNKNSTDCEYSEKWGFTLDELYKLGLQFYKEKNDKALHLSYKDKLSLLALTKQAAIGAYSVETSPEVGFLDVIGNDRKTAWVSLGDMSITMAKAEFVKRIDQLSVLFAAFISAHRTERDEDLRLRAEEAANKVLEAASVEQQRIDSVMKQRQAMDQERQALQAQQIRMALNQQTTIQFRQYAEQQCPNDLEQQEMLIGQLQEQHFAQYMQQVYQQQLLHQQQQRDELKQMNVNSDASDAAVNLSNDGSAPIAVNSEVDGNFVNKIPPKVEDSRPLVPASIWTRVDIAQFKASIRQRQANNILKVASLATVTVRVPTHENGSCLFWEFSSDSYDLGFGVYFEWTIAPTSEVSVHISESSDEDEDDEDTPPSIEGVEGGLGELENGCKTSNGPPLDEIIPVYRRDCHKEVYCGSHVYPGRGVYLLKFDNSYSLWRSKTLYYRVYYTE